MRRPSSCGPASIPTMRRGCARRRCSWRAGAPRPRASRSSRVAVLRQAPPAPPTAATTSSCATRSWRSSKPRCRSTACSSACTARWSRTATTTSKATSSSACARSSGRTASIGVELDPHCHMTLKRVRLADVIVCYKEFPHTDVVERAEDLLDLVLGTLRGKIKPVMSLYDCRQISSYPTTLPLMRAFVDRIKAMEGNDGVLSISIVHCFPYADVPELTSRVLVVTDNDKAKADALAKQLGEELVSMRGKTMPEFFGVEDGLAAALAFDGRPVVIAEPGRQRRRRRAVRQHRDPAPPDRAEGRGGRPRPDLGSDRGAPVLRRRDRRRRSRCASAARPRRPPACRSMPWSRSSGSPATAGRASARRRCRSATAPRCASAASRWC